jgi:hypothetical protein
MATCLLFAHTAIAQQMAPPAPAQPQYAQPQYAQPQYAQPQYAQPQYAQPQYAQPQYAQPQQPPQPRMAPVAHGDYDRQREEGVTAFNAIYAEALGPGGVYSINYERRFGQSGLAGRIGFSYISLGGSESGKVSLLTFPITLSYLGIGNYYHKFEIGAGGMIARVSASAGGIGKSYASASGVGGAGTVLLGYRYQSDGGGFQFRAGISPLFGPGGWLPWGYLSLGGAFGP